MKIDKIMMKKTLIILLAVMLGMPVFKTEAQEVVQENHLKFGRLLRLIDGYYVDTADVEDLTEKAIVHMLSELDPHSTYISPEEVQKMNEPLQGNFEGIGISFNIFKDTLLVTATIAGGPSEKVGLRAGDRIIEVDEKNIAGIGLENSDVLEMLRGEKGTEVAVTVLRKSEGETIDFKIIRDEIPIFSLDASYMLDDETGYIKLNKFSATTTDEFVDAMTDLRQKGLQNLVLDLRGNGGGYLNTAIEISDQFLEDDKLIVYTDGENEPKREYDATRRGMFEEGNLVVLVDETSASASEIVSGAIQDWDRGLIIGRRSYGKGLVQKPYILPDGSMVRLTTAHYYTPSGRSIQKPYDEGIESYRRDYVTRTENGELFSSDSIHFDESLRYETLLNGRPVFGGGGIMPDIFIPLDTSSHYEYYNNLRRNRIILDFVLAYVDEHREQMTEEYSSVEEFAKNFEVTTEMIEEIVENGEEQGIERNTESEAFTHSTIVRQIKGLIARDIFSPGVYYQIVNEGDDAIMKALQVIENQNEYNNLLVSSE